MRQVDAEHGDEGLGGRGRWGATSAYGAAHVAKSLFWYGSEVVFAYFLTEFAGLPPARMGLVMGVGLLFSAGMDLLVGFGLRAQLANARDTGRLQALGAVAAAAGLIVFLVTPGVPQPWRWVWALATVSLFRAGFSLYDVPQNALMSVATTSPAARAQVAAVRIAGSGLASIAVAAFVGPLIVAARSGGDGAGLVIGVGAAAAVFAVVSAFVLARVLRNAPSTRLSEQDIAKGVRAWMLAPYVAMMGAMMLAPPLFQKLEPYFAAQILDSATWGGAIIVAAALGITVGQPLWLALFGRTRTRLFLVAAGVQALGGLLFLAVPSSLPAGLAAAAFLVGLGNGGLGVAKWAAFSDAASRHCAGRQGAAFAIFAASGKLALAIGIVVVAAVLETARHDPQVLARAMAAGPVVGSAIMCALALLTSVRQASASGRPGGPATSALSFRSAAKQG